MVVILWTLMVSETMTTQKKKDLKDQYQVTDLKEYDVMRTHTTVYPSRRVITGEQWSKRIYNKRQVIDTEEEVQFKKPPQEIIKRKITR